MVGTESYLEQRRHERMTFSHEMTVDLGEGRLLKGITRDVSLRGVYIQLQGQPYDIREGCSAQLSVEVMGQPMSFPCTVVHVHPDGLGLEVDRKGGRFGFALTSAIFGEMGLSLGSGGTLAGERVRLRVAPPGGRLQEGRIIRLSTRQVRFCNPLDPLAIPLNTVLTLHFSAPGKEGVELSGTVVSHDRFGEFDTCGREARSLCGVQLSGTGAETGRLFQAIVQDVQRGNLERMVKQRAVIHAIESPPPSRKSASQAREDMGRFFGFPPKKGN